MNDVWRVEATSFRPPSAANQGAASEPHTSLTALRFDGQQWQTAFTSEFAGAYNAHLNVRHDITYSNQPVALLDFQLGAALETLTIIAYNQPVSRSFIEQVRGVDSSSSVSSLEEKGLIEEAGRLDLPGRPVSFRTTDVFLRTFGLTSLAELPPLHEDDVTPMMTERTLAGELAAQAQPGETDGGAE